MKKEKMKLSGHDQAVMATSNDALVTKVYSAQLNYMVDPFSKLFLKNKRKLYPIINRGTWARVQAYRQIVLKYLNALKNVEEGGKKINILSLGSGYDTMFFWLKEFYPDISANICYIEVDFDKVVERKIEVIKKNANLLNMIEDPKFPESTSDINASNYKLLACDVRKTDELSYMLTEEYKVDNTAPTLILTECLLIYL